MCRYLVLKLLRFLLVIFVFNVELFVELIYTNVIDRNQVTWRPMETDIHEHG